MNTALSTSPISQLWLRRYSKFVCFYVLFVIFAGAMVTSHDAGLSVPDWPSTYGENMFMFPFYKWIGGIFYEHGHRLVAFGSGSLTLILAVWTFFSERRRWVRNLSFAALGIVVLQACLGGLTVLLRLPASVSVAHGVLAQTFLIVLTIIAYAHSSELSDRAESGTIDTEYPLSRAAIFASSMIFLQLLVGAVMRHTGSGLALLDFPTMGGHWIPTIDDATLSAVNITRHDLAMAPISASQVVVHLAHRCMGAFVGAVLVILAIRIFKSTGVPSGAKRIGVILGFLVVVQFTLGATAVLTIREPLITSVHVFVGAGLLALSVLLVLRLSPVKFLSER